MVVIFAFSLRKRLSTSSCLSWASSVALASSCFTVTRIEFCRASCCSPVLPPPRTRIAPASIARTPPSTDALV
ncbi:hypothetical protein M885DRAFT_51777 [Pelagophyceae sp. CCMP2097]|nr:hypothetical protein M885DRAFT_51777 [Pelagophyceae sp. CCMP2097]